jgi:arylsulfatase A-like enzyme
LHPRAPTIPRLLKAAGYHNGHSGHSGKGRLGEGKPTMAGEGFDDSAACHGPGPKVSPYGDEIPNQAVKFIKANKGRPFYVDVWLHESHPAHSPSKESMAGWQHPDLRQQVYAAVIIYGDNKVGLILEALERSGIAQNTPVVFARFGAFGGCRLRRLRGSSGMAGRSGPRSKRPSIPCSFRRGTRLMPPFARGLDIFTLRGTPCTEGLLYK